MSHQERPLKFTYRPALDGIRGVAILAVLGFHASPGLVPAGFLGVDLFFVLSGFLITSLLLEEWYQTGQVRLAYFYLRRVLRLLPALLALLALIVTLSWLFSPSSVARVNTVNSAITLLYFSNWARAFEWAELGILSHTWSLSIEEQFYLLWPLILVFLLKQVHSWKGRASWVALVALSCALQRAVSFSVSGDFNRLYNGLDTRADALLIGCLIALFFSRRCNSGNPVARVRDLRRGSIAFAILLSLFFGYRGTWSGAFLYYIGLVLSAVASAQLIYTCALPAGRGPLIRLMTSEPLVSIGKISYGLYLWHFPVYATLTLCFPGLRLRVWFPLALGIVGAISLLSYRFVELPFLKLKSRFQPSNLGAAKPSHPAAQGIECGVANVGR